jgi:hypothetical protein
LGVDDDDRQTQFHAAADPPLSTPMPICIECRHPVNSLYTEYSKADDRSLGKGVRLTQCPQCRRFADKYVEHDFVVLFIDLVLIKPQVRALPLLGVSWLTRLGLQAPLVQQAGPGGRPL